MAVKASKAGAEPAPVPEDIAFAAKAKSDDFKAMSLRVPPSLWRDLQLRKLDEDRPVNAIIIDAIEQYLKRAGGRAF